MPFKNSSNVTQDELINLSVELVQGLARKDRFEHLLTTLRDTINCDAVALLSYQSSPVGNMLMPLAIEGLAEETLGRRFMINEHPRFLEICQSKSAVRFPADSNLPDPYDGLIQGHSNDIPIHACMGIPLYFQDSLIGLLTMDSLTPHIFDPIPLRTLETISTIAAVCLNTALTIELLESNVHQSRQIVEELSSPMLSMNSSEEAQKWTS